MSSEPPNQQALVDALERLLTAWAASQHATHDSQLRHQRDAAAEAVFVYLQTPLHGWARRWVRCGRGMQIPPATPEGEADHVKTLALQAFGLILTELKPPATGGAWRTAEHLVGYLLQIAQHRMTDDYYRAYSNHSRPRRTPADDTLHYAIQRESLDGLAHELADQRVSDATDIIERLDAQEQYTAIWAYWQEHLSDIDMRIVQARWATEPPAPFQQIALQLGDGWTADAVRKRWERILKRTRKHFQTP